MRTLPFTRSTRVRALVILMAGLGCEGVTDPGSLKFGTVGEARLELVTPLTQGEGTLVEILSWSSSGPWRITERISYRGQAGDENTRSSTLDPEGLAGRYLTWIAQFNQGTISPIDPPLEAHPPGSDDCDRGTSTSRLVLTVTDDSQGRTVEWARCVEGPLSRLQEFGAEPDPQAARVALAARLMRDNALVDGQFTSAFWPSYPFATLQRGDDTPLTQRTARAILTEEAWRHFWVQHAGPSATPPAVDFETDLVLVAVHPEIRREAGDSIEIRRILPHGEGTTVEMTLRRPGAFCSPAERVHVPFHIVVAPRSDLRLPVAFQTPIREEHVPCGT